MNILKKDYAYSNLSLIDMNGEVWESCINYDGLYEVSNMGRVKSIFRIVLCELPTHSKADRMSFKSGSSGLVNQKKFANQQLPVNILSAINKCCKEIYKFAYGHKWTNVGIKRKND